MRKLGPIVARIFSNPAFRIAGTLLGAAYLVHSVNLGAAFHTLASANLGWMGVALVLTSLATLASVVEWGVLLRASGRSKAGGAHAHLFTWRRLSSSYLQSLFFTQLLPSGVGGDAMRTVEMGKAVGHGNVLASLAASRMAGILGMSCWGLAAAVLLRSWLGAPGLVVTAVLVAVTVAIWASALSADRIFRFPRMANSRRLLVRTFHTFTQTFGGYRRHPHAVAQCIAVGALGWGINIMALDLFAKALGIDVSWSVFALVTPLSLLMTIIPISLNGIGVREGVLVAFLTHAGAPLAHAMAMAVIVDLQMLPFALLGAILWMRHRHRGGLATLPVQIDH